MNELIKELREWLDSQVITANNIGNIRRNCFVPWNSQWNGIVRDETAVRETKSENVVSSPNNNEATTTSFQGGEVKTLTDRYFQVGGIPTKKRYSDEMKERERIEGAPRTNTVMPQPGIKERTSK